MSADSHLGSSMSESSDIILKVGYLGTITSKFGLKNYVEHSSPLKLLGIFRFYCT